MCMFEIEPCFLLIILYTNVQVWMRPFFAIFSFFFLNVKTRFLSLLFLKFDIPFMVLAMLDIVPFSFIVMAETL